MYKQLKSLMYDHIIKHLNLNKMINFSIFLILAGILTSFFLESCTSPQISDINGTYSGHDIEEASLINLNREQNSDGQKFKNVSAVTLQHVNTLILHYDTVKTSLVQSDFIKTQKKIHGLIKEIVDFNNKKALKGDQDAFYLKVGAKLKNNAERIKKSKDINEQREHFSSLTSDLLKIISAFGGNKQEVYHQYCPMAFDNSGGYWLSLNKQIENPYFGDKMLKCGVVRETIK